LLRRLRPSPIPIDLKSSIVFDPPSWLHHWFPAVEGALQAKTGLAMQRASCVLFKYRNIHAGLHRVWQVPEFIKTETTEVVGPVH